MVALLSFSDAEKKFAQCTLTPVVVNNNADGDPHLTHVVVQQSSSSAKINRKYKTDSFYLDSSGRPSISLPLQLAFSSKDVLDEFLHSECIVPMPSNYDRDIIATDGGEEENDNGDDDAATTSPVVSIEAKVTLTFGTGRAITARVENVTILSTKILEEENVLLLQTEIIVRVSRPPDETTTTNRSSNNQPSSSSGLLAEEEAGGVKTQLEITATLNNNISDQTMSAALSILDQINRRGAAGSASLMNDVNNNNRHHDDESQDQRQRSRWIRLSQPPIELHVTLTHALEIAVRSIPGPALGETHLALAIQHSNTHTMPVTITSIALHPGVTRISGGGDVGGAAAMVVPQQQPASSTDKKQQQQQKTVLDMSHTVHWGYAFSETAPELPLTLRPHEAHSCFLKVEAKEDVVSRTCSCPLSISAMLGHPNHRHNIVAALDAHWTTSRTAVEPADSFRVDMHLLSSEEEDEDENDDDKSKDEKKKKSEQCICVVGAPLTVHLEISNLSAETRQLMLLVDNNSNSSTSVGESGASGSVHHRALNMSGGSSSPPFSRWAVVSEKGGYKFGVAGPDIGDRDLLAMDAALVLGEVKGHASTKARLRVIPLREGTLSIPNFFLFDKKSGKRYSVVHRLQAFAQASD